jgi:DNA mismatch repair protein MutS
MFCRIGDFYELFYEDAILVARELQLTLTARDKEKKQPMCGVPYHAAEIYLQRLLRMGYRIALCEQMEDPKTVKGIVKREVTRVLTPGTAVDPALGAGESCWLASVVVQKHCVGIATVDLSTGDFRATEFNGANAWALAVDELGRVKPVELVYASGGLGLEAKGEKPVLRFAKDDKVHEADSAGLDAIRTKTPVEDWVLTAEHALPLLRQHFKVLALDGLGLGGHEAAAIAAGGLVHYLRQTKQGALEHLEPVRFYERCCTRWTTAAPRWASACCGRRCCVRRIRWPRSTRAWRPSPKLRAICASARASAAQWMAYWISNGCSGAWRWIRRGLAKCWGWRRRWTACRVCVRRSAP